MENSASATATVPPTKEQVTEKRTCARCQGSYEITEEDLAFFDKVSPVFNEKKYAIPPPTLCSTCRLQRRLAFRNQMYVYHRPHSTTGKMIFSNFAEEVHFPVIHNHEWHDGEDGLAQGRAYDFSRPFFQQFMELRDASPHAALTVVEMENSDFCNNATGLKNCYLVFNTSWAEDCLYCENIWHSKDCMDCTRCPHCELCYDCTECVRCYNLQGSQFCFDCSDSYYLFNCRSCADCFGCVNLRHQQYCFFNEQLTKEEYERKVAEIQLDSFAQRKMIAERCQEFFQKHPRPHALNIYTQGATGNYVTQSKEVLDSFFIVDGESLRYCFNLNDKLKDCQDYTLYGDGAELIYESTICGGGVFNIRFSCNCYVNSSNLLYCWNCMGCKDCFGCASLNKRQYCIFNKQYTKEEYEELVPKIIDHMRETGEWGEFFPMNIAAQPYNRSYAQRYFPLNQSAVEKQDLWWYDKDEVSTSDGMETPGLPDTLPANDDSMTTKSVLSGRPYRITSREIERCRRFRAPLPRMTYDERMQERAKLLGGITLYDRTCAKTGKAIKTTISPDSPWIVWDRLEYEKHFSS